MREFGVKVEDGKRKRRSGRVGRSGWNISLWRTMVESVAPLRLGMDA